MRFLLPAIVLLIVIAALAPPASAQLLVDREKMSVRDGQLWQGKNLFTMRAISVPDLLALNALPYELAKALDHVAEVGGNTVAFTLSAYNDDGTLRPDAAKAVKDVIEQVTWRRMTGICRVLPNSALDDPGKCLAMARAAADGLKSENRVVYWIEGHDLNPLLEAFRERAPQLVVAAKSDGDVEVVKELPANDTQKPAMLEGQIPPLDRRAALHFVLPADEASYASLDAAMKNPAESLPWTPDNSLLSEQERADGFVSLFDGKTLDGWWIIGKNQNGFAVTDGTIQWKSEGGGGLYTRDRYNDFVLRLDWRINKGGNSGIYLRAPRAGRQSKVGMEFQLQGDEGTPVTDQTTGAVYSVVAPKVNATKPAGEWNTIEIALNGAHLKAVLNGQVVQDTDLDQSDELRARLRNGFIGLQDHASFVAFRNIRVKRL